MTVRPVFVLGTVRRSGTNFLRDLLVLHPRREPARVQVTGRLLPVPEDFFVHQSDSLLAFSAHLTARFNPATTWSPRGVSEWKLSAVLNAVIYLSGRPGTTEIPEPEKPRQKVIEL